ncbi:MAG: PKD domain-containing protein [Candidatus Poseidoniia archaeon]|nr:PKD domain-containing protein [Candidatus Poseidoniia archaeon]
MKKISFLLIILLFAVAASGGYGYYTFVLNEDDDEDSSEPVGSSGNEPVAKITPSNPKIQINETISFSASGSTDADGDELSFFWSFEGDSKEYEGADIDRNFPDKGEYRVVLRVIDSTGLSDEAETKVLVVENYHDEQSGNVNGNDNSADIDIPVENGFLTLELAYSLDSANVNPLEESQVALRLTDADGTVVQEETGVSEGDGTWSYSTDDLSSTGNYVFTIESESGSMDFDITIDVTY